jgi:hypothetical protein
MESNWFTYLVEKHLSVWGGIVRNDIRSP